jgi:hypothetical protein
MKPSSEDTLTLLTGCVEWWGRYPVPKGKKSFHDFHTLYKKVMYTTNKFRGFDILKATDALSWESFNELWTEAQVQFFRKYQL